jgi:hypothetical protein
VCDAAVGSAMLQVGSMAPVTVDDDEQNDADLVAAGLMRNCTSGRPTAWTEPRRSYATRWRSSAATRCCARQTV